MGAPHVLSTLPLTVYEVKDLWLPNQKAWNAELVISLFSSQTANAILQTPIITSDGRDTLVWKLTPARDCTSKEFVQALFQQSRPACKSATKCGLFTDNISFKSGLVGEVHGASGTHFCVEASLKGTPTGDAIFCDASWKTDQNAHPTPAGIDIFIEVESNQHFKQLYVSALSPPATSLLEAKAFGLLLATKLAEILQLQEPVFYTDCSVLASTAAASNIMNAPDVLDPLGAPTSMARLLSLMEDVASQIGGLSSTAGAGTSRLARWVAKEDDDAVYLKVPMPGLTKEHVEVRADKNILVIKGEGEKQPWDGDDDSAVPRYNRRIEMPAADAYKMDKIKAEMKNGVLWVTLLKVKEEERKDVFHVKVE
uniref:Uncharacterized protein n=1 Tax=Aegilops tauschii TaxID=37682 RepID=N1R525_AEGTA